LRTQIPNFSKFYFWRYLRLVAKASSIMAMLWLVASFTGSYGASRDLVAAAEALRWWLSFYRKISSPLPHFSPSVGDNSKISPITRCLHKQGNLKVQ
jgi:hypothetical protein